jgi:hypothetical protein
MNKVVCIQTLAAITVTIGMMVAVTFHPPLGVLMVAIGTGVAADA